MSKKAIFGTKSAVKSFAALCCGWMALSMFAGQPNSFSIFLAAGLAGSTGSLLMSAANDARQALKSQGSVV